MILFLIQLIFASLKKNDQDAGCSFHLETHLKITDLDSKIGNTTYVFEFASDPSEKSSEMEFKIVSNEHHFVGDESLIKHDDKSRGEYDQVL